MPDIIFDAFHPNAQCLLSPPKNPQQRDPCEVEVHFRSRSDPSSQNRVIHFRRNQDKFVLNAQGNEVNLAIIRGLGFSDSDPTFQSSLSYSVGLDQVIQKSYENYTKRFSYSGPSLLPLSGKMRNFVVTGSIQDTDPIQKNHAAILLKEIFQLPPEARPFFNLAAKHFATTDQAILLPAMRSRIQWLNDLLQTFDRFHKVADKSFSPDSPAEKSQALSLRRELEQWLVPTLVYLGTGVGDWPVLLKKLDPLSIQLRRLPGAAPNLEDVFAFFLSERFPIFAPLEKSSFFSKVPEARHRWEIVFKSLQKASESHRAELLENPSDAFARSIQLRLLDQGLSGRLTAFVQEEMKASHLSAQWLEKRAHLEEIAEAIAPSLKEVRLGEGTSGIRLDLDRLKGGIEKLMASHGIQDREFTIGCLAALRFFFGRNLEKKTIEVWVKNQHKPVSIDLPNEARKELGRLMKSLEWRVSTSLKRTQRSLPWIEGAVCAAGLAIGGAGIGTHNRALTVGGSTGGGLGCGSLLTHFIVRSRNPYISDSIGGLIGAGAGFGLSFFLTRPGGKPTMMPPPPPPPDRNGRNPTGGFGP